MTTKKINLCRDLFQIVSNVDLHNRNKLDAVIEIEVELLQKHIDTCGICQSELKKLVNPMNIFNLMKGGLPVWLK